MVFIIVWHYITYLFDTRAKKKSSIKHVGTELRTINSLRQYDYLWYSLSFRYTHLFNQIKVEVQLNNMYSVSHFA